MMSVTIYILTLVHYVFALDLGSFLEICFFKDFSEPWIRDNLLEFSHFLIIAHLTHSLLSEEILYLFVL